MRLWLFLLALLVLPTVGRAQTCNVTISNVDFGAADLLPGTVVDTTGTITGTCSGLAVGVYTQVCLALGAGTGGASGASRLMTGPGGATLSYSLYADAGRTAPWGPRGYTSLGAVYGQGSSTGSVSTTAPLYGRIAVSQSTKPTGDYSSVFTGADVDLFTLSSSSTDCNAGPVAATPRATTTFSVKAAPAPHCSLTTTDVVFGSQGVLTQNVDANGGVTVRCTSALPYNVGLSNGVTGTSPTARKMTNGSGVITYGLYRNTPGGLEWGSTIGTNTVSGTGTGLDRAYVVYGRVGPQTTPVAGNYTDTVNVTVTY